jgi:hypothetical protein
MSEKAHPCPKCGGLMNYRLGEFQCGSCDYSEQASAQQKEERGAGASYRHETWQPGVGSTLTPGRSSFSGKLITPPDAPGSQAGAAPPAFTGYDAAPPPPPPPGTVFGQTTWEHGADRNSDVVFKGDTLAGEKRIYFIVYVALQALAIIFMLLFLTLGRKFVEAALAAGAQPLTSQSAGVIEMLPTIVVMYIIAILIAVGLTWWVLYGTEIWAKWCCMGCSGVGLLLSLGQLISVFAPSALLMASGAAGALGGGSAAVTIIMVIIQVGWQAWFMSILYRDIQQRQYQ